MLIIFIVLRSTPDAKAESPLLHSGPMLGDLPALVGSGDKSGRRGLEQTANSVLDDEDGFGLSNVNRELLLSKNRLKKRTGKKNKKPITESANMPSDVPYEFICELSKKPMSDPVETLYGNYFEKSAILGKYLNIIISQSSLITTIFINDDHMTV